MGQMLEVFRVFNRVRPRVKDKITSECSEASAQLLVTYSALESSVVNLDRNVPRQFGLGSRNIPIEFNSVSSAHLIGIY